MVETFKVGQRKGRNRIAYARSKGKNLVNVPESAGELTADGGNPHRRGDN